MSQTWALSSVSLTIINIVIFTSWSNRVKRTFLVSAVVFQVFHFLVQEEGFRMQMWFSETTLHVLIQITSYAINKYLIVF